MNKSAKNTVVHIFFVCVLLIITLYFYQQGYFNNRYDGLIKDNMINVSDNPLVHNISGNEKERVIKEHYMPIIKKNKPIGPAFGFHEYFDKFHNKVNDSTLGWRKWWLKNKTDFSKLPHDPNFTNISPIHKWKMDRYID